MHLVQRLLLVLIALPLLLTACGGADSKALTDEAVAKLGAGDSKGALASFDAALAGMDASSPDRLRAELGRCQALAREDPKRAQEEFLALARAKPSQIKEQDYGLVVKELVSKGAINEAIDLMNAGMKMFPESPRMQAIRDQVVEASKKSKDPAALSKLKGLGYAGND